MSPATTHIETKKQLVPALRFNEFDKAWGKEKLLGHVNSISSGKIKPDKEGKYLVYGSTGVIGKSDEFTHEGDYLLIARVGANAGKINRVRGKYAVTDNTLIIDLKDSVDVAFCESFLIKFNLNRLIFGSGQPLITGGLLKSLDFIFPYYLEQQKIASFLSAVDEKIQQLTKKKALLEQYKKGVMQQLFSGQLHFKDENGNPYPDWEEKRLGEIAEIVGGGTPETVKPDYWDGEIQWFTPTEIRSKYISNSKRTITQSGLSKSSAKLLPAGTILFTSRATIAELGFATQECSTNQGFQSLIVNQNNNSEFIYQLIKVNKNEFVKKSQGSTFLEISSKEMKKMKFNTPILEEQQKIATYLAGIDTKIENVNTQIIQTQTFKKGLLQQLFV
jgi:type I restriction enzyme S subunit